MRDEERIDGTAGRVVVTRRRLSAVTIDHAAALHGPVVQIPPGTELVVCAKAPDARLVQVRWGASRYAVFAVDLHDESRDAS